MRRIRRVLVSSIGILSCLAILYVAGTHLRGPSGAPTPLGGVGLSDPSHSEMSSSLLEDVRPPAEQGVAYASGSLPEPDGDPYHLATQEAGSLDPGSWAGINTVPSTPASEKKHLGHVCGEVRDESGTSVARAFVSAYDTLQREQTSMTDAEGRFVLDSDGSEEWALVVQAEGYVPWEGTARVGETPCDLHIVLTTFGDLLGTVTGGMRDGVRLRVFAQPLGGQGKPATASCDKKGRFAMGRVVPGVYELGLAWNGFRRTTGREVKVLAGQSTEVHLEGPPTGAVKVEVIVPRNTVLPGDGALTITDVSTNSVTELGVRVGEDGQFQLDDFPAGAYQAALAIPGLARLPEERFQVSASGLASVQFRWPTATIEGDVGGGPYGPASAARLVLRRVVDVGDHASAMETIASQETLADQQGHFTFAGLGKGRYVIVALGDAGQDSGEVELDDNGLAYVNLWLDSGGPNLTLRVVHQGVPAPGAQVFLSRLPHGEMGGFGITDDRGEVKVGPLNSGNYSVEARQIVDDKTLLIAHAEVEIRGSDSVAPLQLELE